MAVLSRAQAKQAFEHVMNVVLERGNDSHLKSALLRDGINDIYGLLNIRDNVIDSLQYCDPNDSDTLKPVTQGDKGLVRCFLDYVLYRNESGDPIGNGWLAITPEGFDAFRVDPNYIATTTARRIPVQSRTRTTEATTTSPPVSVAAKVYSPAELFRRGIKRDPSLFPTLKDERFNDTWHRSFANQARAQDLSEVLDATYKPSAPEDVELFQEKQKYMYAVLEAKVLTDRGKAIIREHESDFDAQAVYKKLSEHHLRSTKAMIGSSVILSYITSARLGNGEWQGTTEGFILHWQNQVRLYERQVPFTDHFSDGQKRTMLENAVAPVEELRQVKINAELHKTKTGESLSYEEYVSLLLSAASTYDDQFKPKKVNKQRSIYAHDFEDYSGDYGPVSENEEFQYNIDSPVNVIQAYAHKRQNLASGKHQDYRPRMSRDKWYSLSEEDQKLWDQLGDKAKSIILGITPADGSKSYDRKVNLHQISAYDFLRANLHELDNSLSQGPFCQQDPATGTMGGSNELEHDNQSTTEAEGNEDSHDLPSETRLINAVKSGNSGVNGKLAPGDIRRVMSKNSKRTVKMANITYTVSNHQMATTSSLVDRGANGGVAGTDVRIVFKTNRSVDIRGIDNHQVTDIDIGTVGGVVESQKGPVIAVMHQYALLCKGASIHSPCQFEAYMIDVDDKSVRVGGQQRIKTPDGYIIPLSIKDGLARLDIRPYTDQEWEELPHVFLTSEVDWDPTIMDHEFRDIEEWFDATEKVDTDPSSNRFDEIGNYRRRAIVQQSDLTTQDAPPYGTKVIESYNLELDGEKESEQHLVTTTGPNIISAKEPDYASLRPLFGWISADTIKKTFENTTQYARIPTATMLKRTFRSPNPALNVYRRNESVACDVVYADVPAIADGSIAAVLFTGLDTHVTDIYGIKSDKEFVNTLEDNIRQRGAPNKLISDRAQVEISKRVLDILRTLCIGDWQSEPHQQQQNPAERRYQTVKATANRILDRTGAPAYTWLLCLKYTCYLLNHTYNTTMKGVPLQHLTGTTVDISPLLRFHFWQKVYYKKVDNDFPSESAEAVGHVVGISEHCGHAMTWMVLTTDTKRILYRSLLRPISSSDCNLRADLSTGEDSSPTNPDPIIKSRQDFLDLEGSEQVTRGSDGESSKVVDPEALIGRTFHIDDKETGEPCRARVVKLVEDHENRIEGDPTRLKFVLSVNEDKSEEIITYNELLGYMARDEENNNVWKFSRIVAHEGPLKPGHRNYKGSQYNVMIEWENGETSVEPLRLIVADNPVMCAIYARDNGLLDLPGWKRLKGIAKRLKKFERAVNQVKLRASNAAPKYKYGHEVPRSYAHAIRIDERNRNRRWQEAIELELQQINEYGAFTDLGHHTKTAPPDGYKKIRVHLVFDVKHDGRHKARLVADGHLTDVPDDSVYSGVVSLRGFRIVLFLAELNNLQMWATDIGNAYLEAITSEKVYIIAGPEFGDLEGHILVIHKALYGLRSSGARWHDRFADCLREMGFSPCKAEPDVWMRKNGSIYEYIAVYVDDLGLALKQPQDFIDALQNKYKFKLKGTGPISFHLGMDFSRDSDGTLCIAPLKYIEKMVSNYERVFGETPKKNVTSPLEKGDHPELDTSELLDAQGIALYQSLIGALQWIVTIGRFDVNTAVMTLSGFRVAPRRGHLERVKRVYGYLSKMRHAAIRIRTGEPDYSDLPDPQYDWSRTVYGTLEEDKPRDAPEPLGQYVTLTHYVDANLMHDVTTGRSVTGILHLLNKTPIDWFSKKQATVETATYGSEFVAARTCVEQIIDLRNTLRYLGVPIRDKSYLFGDNKSVVDSSMQVHAKLHKRHTILSFHRVRETIAAGMVGFYYIPGEQNPADILSKHWGYSQVWTQLKALLFWHGDTEDIDD
jgi:hypothetical protein